MEVYFYHHLRYHSLGYTARLRERSIFPRLVTDTLTDRYPDAPPRMIAK